MSLPDATGLLFRNSYMIMISCKSKELDDNSPEKSDLKDPKTIALLVKDGRFSASYLPSGVYAEIREASVCRDQLMKQHVRLSNQIRGRFCI